MLDRGFPMQVAIRAAYFAGLMAAAPAAGKPSQRCWTGCPTRRAPWLRTPSSCRCAVYCNATQSTVAGQSRAICRARQMVRPAAETGFEVRLNGRTFLAQAAMLRECTVYKPPTAVVQSTLKWAFADLEEAAMHQTAFSLLKVDPRRQSHVHTCSRHDMLMRLPRSP